MSIQGKKGTLSLRKWTGLAFLLLYVLIGLPVWYKLTTVYRAVLPVEYIESLYQDKHQDINLAIPVYIDMESSIYNFPDLVDAVQLQIDYFMKKEEWDLDWSIKVSPLAQHTEANEFDDYIVKLELDDHVGCSVIYNTKTTVVFFNNESVAANDLPFFIAQSLIEHTFKSESEAYRKNKLSPKKKSMKTKSLAIDYTSNVHISISLLSGSGVPVSWDIDSVLSEYFTPFRRFLSPIVNFTVDTDIVYYNDLNLHKLKDLPADDQVKDISTIIDLSELTSKNNYYPGKTSVINLVIVFPEEDLLENFSSTKDTEWESYLVPQWGSLFINKFALPESSGVKISSEYLKPIIYKFSNEIFQLLGLLEYKENIDTPLLTVDSFKRITTIFNNLDKSIETMNSLVEMTEKLPEMAIPEEVATDIEKALNMRLHIIEHYLNNPENSDWDTALKVSNEIREISEKAFFHKAMVQENFVPQEHKIAVYLPLLGPLSIVCFTGVLKLFKEKTEDEENEEDEETKKNQ